MNYYLEAFKNYAKPQGRTKRKEFWYFILIHFIIISGLALLIMFATENGSDQLAGLFMLAYTIYFFATIVPLYCLMVRRLHDSGKSAWFLLLGLIPIGGIALVVLFALPSMADNKYGAKE